MLLSMTGFGGAKTTSEDFEIVSEIKTVNNRYFKLSTKLPESISSLEVHVEPFIRQTIHRGTVQVNVRIESHFSGGRVCLDLPLLENYMREINAFCQKQAGASLPMGSLGDFLRLPNVVVDRSKNPEWIGEAISWEKLGENLLLAVQQLQQMRQKEGAQMVLDLSANCDKLKRLIDEIERLAPTVIDGYRARLTERISHVMREQHLDFSPTDLIREIALYTDKVDISEEIVRFRSHITQFEQAMRNEDQSGKKLDFLTQELFRETNTIGSKANSSEITILVVECKSVIERIREMVQNVE